MPYYLSDYGDKFQPYHSLSGTLRDDGELIVNVSLQICSNETWFVPIGEWVCTIFEIVVPGALTLPENGGDMLSIGKSLVKGDENTLRQALQPYANDAAIDQLFPALSTEYRRFVKLIEAQTVPTYSESDIIALNSLTARDAIPGVGRLSCSYSSLYWRAEISPDADECLVSKVAIHYRPSSQTQSGYAPFPTSWMPSNEHRIFEQSDRRIYYGNEVTRAITRGKYAALGMDYLPTGGMYFGVSSYGLTQEERDSSASRILNAIIATPWCGLQHISGGVWSAQIAPHDHEGAWPYWGRSSPTLQDFQTRWGHNFATWGSVDIYFPEHFIIYQSGRRIGRSNGRVAAAGIVPVVIILLFLMLLCCVGDTNDHASASRRRRTCHVKGITR